MSKGLEALERITEHLDLEDEYFYKQEKVDEEIIKQALKDYEELQKVLEIINNKEILLVYKDYQETCYLVANGMAIEITQEEFDLLKEVLLWLRMTYY